MATASQPLVRTSFDLDGALWGFVTRELGPTPGRLSFAARTAIAAAIMLLIGEACHSETLFVALFTPLLLPRETPQQTWAGTKGTIIIVWAACAGAIVLVLLTAELPWIRVSALAFGIFVCMILSRGLHQPALAALGPVTISEVLIRMDTVNSAESAITAGLWMALMMSVGCLVATAVDFLYPHPGPRQRITSGIVDRLEATAAVLKKSGGAALSAEEQQKLQALAKLSLAGTSSLRKLLPALSTQPSIDQDYMLRLSAVLNGIDFLSDQAVQLSNRDSTHALEEQKDFTDKLARSCLTLADHVQRNITTPRENEEAFSFAGHHGSSQLIADIGFQLDTLWSLWSSDAASAAPANPIANQPDQAPPPQPHPFVTPDDIRFAVKVMLACMICYVIYNGVAWQGISTALVTCFFAADTTIGGTLRKLALRITGVLVGGLLFGIGGIVLITSHLDNVFEFMLYVAMVFFVAGWVSKGSPRVSYAGSQIAISYSFAALLTPAITSEIVQPRDRLVGVLLGTVVMWFVFTRLWPLDTLATQKEAVAGLLRTASKLALLTIDDSHPDTKSTKVRELREAINKGIAQAEDQADLADYESKTKQSAQSALRKCLASTQDLLMLEVAQAELSTRSQRDGNASEAFDKKNAQQAADYLCLMAQQIVEGSEPLLRQLSDKGQQLQASNGDASNDSDVAERDNSDPHQAFINANTHIYKRRNRILNDLFLAVEEVPLTPR